MESTLSCLRISISTFLNQDVQGKIFDIINKALRYFMTSYYSCSNKSTSKHFKIILLKHAQIITTLQDNVSALWFYNLVLTEFEFSSFIISSFVFCYFEYYII